jgi:lipid-binding SYLF domain-containing protein
VIGRRLVLAGLALRALWPEDEARASSAAAIDAAVQAAIPRLHAAAPEAEALMDKAEGVLIFPEVVKGGVLIGGQDGEGARLVDGETEGYFNTIAASFGLQLGGRKLGYAMFPMTNAAMDYLKSGDGWDVGTAPSVVYGDEAWSGGLGVAQTQDILIVVFGRKGAMAGAGIQGAKISRIEADA